MRGDAVIAKSLCPCTLWVQKSSTDDVSGTRSCLLAAYSPSCSGSWARCEEGGDAYLPCPLKKPRPGYLWKKEGLLASESLGSTQCQHQPLEGAPEDHRTPLHPTCRGTLVAQRSPPWSGDPETHWGGCANPRETRRHTRGSIALRGLGGCQGLEQER